MPPVAVAVPPSRSLSVFSASGAIGDIALGPDGAMWVTGAHRLVRIDATGRITYQPVHHGPPRFPLLSDGIVAGPDGAVWFGDGQVPGVDRYVPGAPTVQRYRVPGLDLPARLAVGPDRAIWVTDWGGNQILRLGLDGTTRFVHLGPFVQPTAIVAGPDGALWVADSNAPHLLRVQPSGSVQTFTLEPVGRVTGLTVGPDGAIWFVGAGPRIWRMTVDGEVRQYEGGLTRDAWLEEIVTGPDGNLWFSDRSGAIGRITLAGDITRFATFRSPPYHIAAGPDHALWFTSLDGETVGRVPTNVCASRRVIRLHLRAPRHDRIASVRVRFLDYQRWVRGRWSTVPVSIDLRGYIGGVVRVHIHLRTDAHHRIDTVRTFHTCR